MSFTLPTPNDAAEARTLTNIVDRAARLEDEGYMIWYFAAETWFVRKPNLSEVVYEVSYGEKYGYSCDCECFKSRLVCKHLLAVDKKATEEAEAERFASLMENAESPFGTDPHSEF